VIGAVVGLVGVIALVVAIVVVVNKSKPAGHAGSAATTPSASTAGSAAAGGAASKAPATSCQFQPDGQSPAKPVSPPPADAATAGARRAEIKTDQGTIAVDLDAKAPCTVASFLYLGKAGFYAQTKCHRLVTEGFTVLQCGDPTGTGTGGPGYKFADENLPVGARPSYQRGTLAMANSGPGGTNGSQFFFVVKDVDNTVLPPNYTIFGKVSAGLDILDKVVAAGHDGAYAQQAGGGHPKLPVTIQSVS